MRRKNALERFVDASVTWALVLVFSMLLVQVVRAVYFTGTLPIKPLAEVVREAR